MKKYIFLFIILLSVAVSISAQTANPFELSDSDVQVESSEQTDQNNEIVPVSIPSSSTIGSDINQSVTVNPFEINNESQIVREDVQEPTIPLNQESQEESNSVIPAQAPEVYGNPFSLESGVEVNNDSKDRIEASNANSEVQVPNEEEVKQVFSSEKTSSSTNIFVFWISILSGLILSILLTINRGVIVKIWKGIKNNNFMILFQKEERNGNSVSFGLLYLCFIVNVAAFITMIVRRQNYDFLNQSFFKILLLVIGIVILRHLIMTVMRLISNAKKEINNYYFSIISINSLLGIVLIPINLLLAFGPSYTHSQSVFLGVLILLGCLLLRWIKGITNSLRLIFNASFHFFLYLCTAEMLPLLIGIRIYLNLI